MLHRQHGYLEIEIQAHAVQRIHREILLYPAVHQLHVAEFLRRKHTRDGDAGANCLFEPPLSHHLKPCGFQVDRDRPVTDRQAVEVIAGVVLDV